MFKKNQNIFEKSVINFVDEVYGTDYAIPAFQRGYKWGNKTKKIIDCLDSINRGFNLGSIIIWNSKIKGISRVQQNLNMDRDNDVYSYIIDGQQRTLTLVSLFSRDSSIDPAGISNKPFYIIYNSNQTISFSDKKDKNKILLPLSKFNKHFVYGISKDFNFEKEYKKEIAEGKLNDIKSFKRCLINFENKLKTKKILIGYKVGIAKDDLNVAIKQFEKINSAGIKLQEFDILDAVAFSDNKYKLANVGTWVKNSKFDGLTKADNKEYSSDVQKIILNSYKLIKNHQTNLENKKFSLSSEAISNFKKGDSKIFKTIFKYFKEFISEANTLGLGSLKDIPWTHNVVTYIFLKSLPELNEGFKNIDDKSFIYNVMFLTGIQKSYASSASQALITHIKKLYDSIIKNEEIFINDYEDKKQELTISEKAIMRSSYKDITSMEKAIFIYMINTLKPRDYIQTDSTINFKGVFKKSKQMDHIFPHSKYKKDNIGNIALIQKDSNIQKSDQKPSEFFSSIPYEENFEMYKSQLILEDEYKLLLDDDIEEFIEKRTINLTNSINEHIKQLKGS